MNTIIEKIRAEVRNRIQQIKDAIVEEFGTETGTYLSGKKIALEEFDFFLAYFEKECEKPTNIDFEQELYKHFGQVKDFTLGMQIGKHFYELGCRRTAEKYDEIEYKRQGAEEETPKDLEEAAMEYEHIEGHSYYPSIKDAFIAGAKWQMEQMMKKAVEGAVSAKFGTISIPHNIYEKYDGQKVKLIIVKED